LESAIDDYNETFGTSYDTSSNSFESYYKDLTKRLKNRDLDLVIVVNMLLTGFDATTLNTLWVDKNLRQHGLIQAFSRTNRILNSVKTYGNIVCFRDLESNTNDAISMFGNKEAGGVVLLRPYREYYEEYAQVVQELTLKYEPGVIPASETEQKDFVSIYNKMVRLKNILDSFDEFQDQQIIPTQTQQDYRSTYLEIYQDRVVTVEKESILKDIEFEIELVKQVEINVDYILMLVKQLQEKKPGSNEDKELKATIDRAVDSSFSLRSKKDLIEKFIRNINVIDDVDRSWQEFISDQKALELQQIIEDENLDEVATRMFIEQAFRDGSIRTEGVSITRLMPAKSMFTPDDEHGKSKQKVADRLKSFFERFFSLA
jgi:type I restriction enzyme R subunit